MQRENNFLSPFKKRGFAMIMAMMVIVIFSTIMAYTLTLTSHTSKQTSDIYLHEQAVLLAQSAVEFTLLAISGHNRGTTTPLNCLGKINATYPDVVNPIFDINVTIKYIGFDCSDNSLQYNKTSILTTPESNGTVILDVIVSTSKQSNIATEPIRYFRRTLQKL